MSGNGNGIEWAVATRPLEGEVESGDRHLVVSHRDGALIAAIDGLGHGAEAGRAADRATAALRLAPRDEPLLQLLRRCHDALSGTRGAVMSLAMFHRERHTLMWLGVGNVEGLLVRKTREPTERLVGRGGVVGDRLPPLMASLLPVAENDTLVLATDGISSNFEDSLVVTDTPRVNADRILTQHHKRTDDALVVVARFGWESRP